MICPLKLSSSLLKNRQCDKESCQWWDSKANFNSETKQFEGQCCILTLSRLKVSGGINTHPFQNLTNPMRYGKMGKIGGGNDRNYL